MKATFKPDNVIHLGFPHSVEVEGKTYQLDLCREGLKLWINDCDGYATIPINEQIHALIDCVERATK